MLWIQCGYRAKLLCEAEKCAAGQNFVVFGAQCEFSLIFGKSEASIQSLWN